MPDRCIYIPLCFYYISQDVTFDPEDPANLHSTMLLLYLVLLLPARPSALHLHSTMLLLYRKRIEQHTLKRYYLHSTMLLLYRASPQHMLHHISIIYIPLCFYYISTCQTALSICMTFTFHYASTIS